jgi:hypothetical protein
MFKSVRIVPKTTLSDRQTITFVLATGTVRHTCRLETTFRTRSKAFGYLHKHRTALERVARARLARGEINGGVIHLTML